MEKENKKVESNTQEQSSEQGQNNEAKQPRKRAVNPFRNKNKQNNQTTQNNTSTNNSKKQYNNNQRNSNRSNNQRNNRNNNRNNTRNTPRLKIDTSVPEEMRKSILENERVQQERMNPWKKIALNSGGKIRFTPLGGLGEIGGNIAVLETETTAIIIDVGMSFPDETMHGVDILVPDFSYLHAIKDKIKAIVITHGHEDHIGAMPYLFKELKFPIYATPLALAMIGL